MKTLKNFIQEEKELDEYIRLLDLEESAEEDLWESTSPVEGGVSSDTKGKMHELLVGYHLLGGKHMSKHPDKSGDSPKQAHDKLKSSVHPNDYKKMNTRAKSAANDIKKQVETNGHKIHEVHWTSKPGDIHRSTGIHSSQNEDSSDIVITTHKK